MAEAGSFSLAGAYRVQSRRQARYSELRGTWLTDHAMLDSDRVNAALAQHAAWRGNARVNLKAAHVTHRTGTFASEPDILYKREFFDGLDGQRMHSDIVDVEKSKREWVARDAALSEIVEPATLELIYLRLGELAPVIANEYYVHEAGHFIGMDVLQKYAVGYFSARGSSLWPLIYAEELRADLGSFEFALELLPPADAERVFLYNLALRFGAHRKAVEESGAEVYGSVPYLLFCVLSDIGFIAVQSSGGRHRLTFRMRSSSDIREVMAAAAAHAYEELTSFELRENDARDVAIHVARYLRRRQEDADLRRAFDAVMLQPPRGDASNDR